MQVTTEQIDPCKLALTISVEPEKVAAAKDKAFRAFAANLAIPGFRKGKVPPHMARTYVDPARVNERAAESLIEPSYAEAVAEVQVEPFAQPEYEFVEMNEGGPFVFKALVPTRPVVTLGLYKGLTIERRRVTVGDSDVDDQIENLLSRQAEYPEITDRPTETGDIIMADLMAMIEGQDLGELSEPRPTVIEIGKNIPDFDNGLVGLTIGETKAIDALYPDDFADPKMQGKRATFTVTVNEIRAKVLPEMNEELIAKFSPTAKTLDELKAELHASLEKAADEMADNDLEVRLVGEVVKTSQIYFPDVLLRAEMGADIERLEQRLKRDNATIEQYLEAVGKTGEQVQAEIANAADRRIRNTLVLSEVARTEGIVAEDADIDKQINLRAERSKVSPAAVRAFAEKNDQMGSIRDQALTEKILTFLKGQSTVTERLLTPEEMDAENEEDEGGIAPMADSDDEDETGEITPSEGATPDLVASVIARRRGKKPEAATEAATEEPADAE